MINLKLKRVGKGKESTAGILSVNDKILCQVIELAYKDNQREISCVPTGTYRIAFRKEGGFYNRYIAKKWAAEIEQSRGMLELQDVPGRDYILIHVGNWAGGYSKPSNTEGCLLLNERVSQLENGEWIGSSSVSAYKSVYKAIAQWLEHDDVQIEIVDG